MARPAGYTQITTLTTAVGLGSGTLATIPPNAVFAMIRPEVQAVRWRDDGIDPTAAVGMPLAVGETLVYTGKMSAFKAIEQVASAKLNVTFYRQLPAGAFAPEIAVPKARPRKKAARKAARKDT